MTALVTGSAGGIGRAIVAKLRAEGFEVKELDLVNGFDVTDPAAWEHVGSVDLACLNAGVLTGDGDIAALTDAQYRRAVGVNVDGVVYGVRRLDRVMPTGSAIVVTASLAGLVGIPDDPVYGDPGVLLEIGLLLALEEGHLVDIVQEVEREQDDAADGRGHQDLGQAKARLTSHPFGSMMPISRAEPHRSPG